MSSRCPDPRRWRALLVLPWAAAAFAQSPPELSVCADPDNLPFSQRDGSGLENRIAQVVADELHLALKTVWLPQRRGFVRRTLGARACDVLAGVPADLPHVLATRPYYRSSYVFVTRAGEPAPLVSFDDPRLRRLRVGVQLVGNDLAATPPGHALVLRGAVDRVSGFPVEGEGPAARRMLEALARGRLDAALLWGPQAGWFAQRAGVPLQLARAWAPAGLKMPFEFAIAMAVRPGDTGLHEALEGALQRRQAEIDALLQQYGVPRTDGAAMALR